jgi:hypothetical protein
MVFMSLVGSIPARMLMFCGFLRCLMSGLFTAGTPDNVATIQPWKYTPAGSLRYRSVFRVHQAARLVVLQAIFQHPVVAAGLLTLGVVVVFYCVSGVIGALFTASPRKPKSE